MKDIELKKLLTFKNHKKNEIKPCNSFLDFQAIVKSRNNGNLYRKEKIVVASRKT